MNNWCVSYLTELPNGEIALRINYETEKIRRDPKAGVAVLREEEDGTFNHDFSIYGLEEKHNLPLHYVLLIKPNIEYKINGVWHIYKDGELHIIEEPNKAFQDDKGRWYVITEDRKIIGPKNGSQIFDILGQILCKES